MRNLQAPACTAPFPPVSGTLLTHLPTLEIMHDSPPVQLLQRPANDGIFAVSHRERLLSRIRMCRACPPFEYPICGLLSFSLAKTTQFYPPPHAGVRKRLCRVRKNAGCEHASVASIPPAGMSNASIQNKNHGFKQTKWKQSSVSWWATHPWGRAG